MLNDREYKNLDGLRQTLATFWNEWEIECNEQNMSVINIVKRDLVQGQTPDVVMLAYLEIARGFHRKENSRGKQGLFRVAKDFREFSNS